MIRKIRADDRETYCAMATRFYRTPAVQRPIPARHIADTFCELMRSDAYAEAYIFEDEGRAAGYALLAKTFSQEAGGPVLWVEEIYVEPESRGCGLGRAFFDWLLANRCRDVKRLRLEVEDDNVNAVALYRKCGFTRLGYSQMVREL